MFDISWQELFVIAVIVVIVIGPKDLPRALRSIAGWVRKARSLAREFQGGVDEMIRESELDDVRKQIESIERYDIGADIKKDLDPTGEFTESLSMKDVERDLDEAGRAPPPAPAAEPRKAIAEAPGADGDSGHDAGPLPDAAKKTAGKAGG